MRCIRKTQKVTPVEKMGRIRKRGPLDIFRRSSSLKTSQILCLIFLVVSSMGGLTVSNSVWAQPPRLAPAERRPMLARLLRPQSEEPRGSTETENSVGRQNRNGPPSAELTRDVPNSAVSRGDIVVTKESVPLKMGTKTLEITATKLMMQKKRALWMVLRS